MTAYLQVEALVLRTRDYGEKDAMLTLLSKEQGKITIVCKGVKKPVSSMRASAQLFTNSRFFLYEGKSLHTATQAQVIQTFKNLSVDVTKFAAAAFWSELAEVLLPERELNYHVYLLLLKSFNLLDKEFSWALFYAFQVKILMLTGYEPITEKCVYCGKELSNEKYLSVAEGGTLCKACSLDGVRVTEGVIQCLRLFKTARLETITKLKLSTVVEKQLKNFLKNYIEHHTENRLRSADFLYALE